MPTFLHLCETTAQWIILAKLIELTFQLYVSLPNIYFEVTDEKLDKIYIQNCKKMLQVSNIFEETLLSVKRKTKFSRSARWLF